MGTPPDADDVRINTAAAWDDYMSTRFPCEAIAHVYFDGTVDAEDEVRWLNDHGYTFVVTVP